MNLKRIHLLLTITFTTLTALTGCGGDSDSSGSSSDNNSANNSDNSAGGSSEGESSSACELSDLQQELLDAHNSARASARYCGDTYYEATTSLSWSCELAEAADAHNEDMTENNFFSHTGSDGLSAGDRVTSAGYSWSYVGENIAAGQTSVDSVMNSWLNSSGHCANIMSPNFTEMGGNVLESSSADYGIYWTVDFAAPL